jgi:hypothetical protein
MNRQRSFPQLMQSMANRIRTSTRTQQATFTEIFEKNAWGDVESVSGPGSSEARGRDFHDELGAVLDQWHIRSILDSPCGDFNWMRNVVGDRQLAYAGLDIVQPLIDRNARTYAAPARTFVCADMTRAHLPQADLVICRDGLVHLSFADARAALRNFQRSGSSYLLSTTFRSRKRNANVPTGGWRVLNLEVEPFCFPPPLAVVDERCTHTGGIYRDKCMGLWELQMLKL